MIIPDEARRELYLLREALGEAAYLRRIWHDRGESRRKKPQGAWPVNLGWNMPELCIATKRQNA